MQKSTFLHVLIFSFLLFFSAMSAPQSHFEALKLPSKKDPFINDFAALLSQEDRDALIRLLQTFKQDKNTILCIATIDSFPPQKITIERYASDLFTEWELGTKDILFLVAVKNRQLRIEMGYSYNHQYDKAMKGIIDSTIVPLFKQKAYGQGILTGAKEIIARAKEDFHEHDDDYAQFLGIICIICLLLFSLAWGRFDEKENTNGFLFIGSAVMLLCMSGLLSGEYLSTLFTGFASFIASLLWSLFGDSNGNDNGSSGNSGGDSGGGGGGGASGSW